MTHQQQRRPRREPPPPGLLVVDKPAGWTSHDVVGKARGLLGTRKVGHAGTLDPMATGVLVLGVERATKLLGHLTLDTKTYVATIRLGESRSTDDAEGEPTGGADASGLDRPAIDAAMAPLRGAIEQVPSSVSAVKVDGRRAYERVRAGEEVVLAARPVHVERFDVVGDRTSEVRGCRDLDVVVDCSSGTYVRALARDLGAGLGVGGHLTALRRTRVGPFTLDSAATLETLAQRPDPVSLPLADAIRTAFPVRDVDAAEARELSFGRSLEPRGLPGVHGALGPDWSALALLREQDGRARPVLVFAAAG